jgi:hypothetical protein
MPLQRKKQLAVVGAVVVLAIILVVALLAARSSRASSSADSQLKQAAGRALPLVEHPPGNLRITDSSLNSFKAWFYQQEQAFAKIALQSQPAGQYVQVQYDDPNTMPPQALGLNAPGRAFVTIDASVASQAVITGQPQYTDLKLGDHDTRIYVVPIPLPAAFQGSGIYGLLEVLAPA